MIGHACGPPSAWPSRSVKAGAPGRGHGAGPGRLRPLRPPATACRFAGSALAPPSIWPATMREPSGDVPRALELGDRRQDHTLAAALGADHPDVLVAAGQQPGLLPLRCIGQLAEGTRARPRTRCAGCAGSWARCTRSPCPARSTWPDCLGGAGRVRRGRGPRARDPSPACGQVAGAATIRTSLVGPGQPRGHCCVDARRDREATGAERPGFSLDLHPRPGRRPSGCHAAPGGAAHRPRTWSLSSSNLAALVAKRCSASASTADLGAPSGNVP